MNFFNRLMKLIVYKREILFILIFTIVALFYYDSLMDKGPLNMHLWRQTDCLSITQGYSKGASFFKPEMNLQLSDNKTTGFTAGEFPGLYYLVGNIWKIFGESYLSYRLICLLILFAGLFAFYKSLLFLFKDNFWAIALSLLLFTSPIYAVYGVNFLTDVPAFSFILMALYFILQYYLYKKRRMFFIAMAFFAFAGLIKVSSLIAFVFLLFVLTLETFSFKSLGDKKLFKCNKTEWIGFGMVILAIFSWYFYASYFNTIHGFKFALNSIIPIWTLDQSGIQLLFDRIVKIISYIFFSRSMLFLLAIIGIVNVFLWKKKSVFAYLTSIIIPIGGFTYFILWAPQFGVHDYYLVPLLILFVGILIPFFWYLKTNYPTIFKGYILKSVLFIFLVYNIIYCLNVIKLKTLETSGEYKIIGNKEFVEQMQWFNWDYIVNYQRYETMRSYNRQIGIKEEDKIISLSDVSPNTTLFMLGQKGWTNFQQYSKSEEIDQLIQKGAKFMFISEQNQLQEPFLAPFLINKVGNYKGIDVFKLSDNMIAPKDRL